MDKSIVMLVITAVLEIISGVYCVSTDYMQKRCGLNISSDAGDIIFEDSAIHNETSKCTICLTVRNSASTWNGTYRLIVLVNEVNKRCNGSWLRIIEQNNTSEYYENDMCKSSEEIECSQQDLDKLCIPNDSICTRQINICQMRTCDFGQNDYESSQYLKYIICGFSGLFLLYVVYFFYHQYQKGLDQDERCWTKVKQTLLRRKLVFTNGRNSLENILSSRRCSIQSSESTGSNERQISSERHSQDVYPQGTFVVIPSAPVLEEIYPELNVSIPPSYEETIVPSYQEVMDHKDKYDVHG